MNRLIIMRLFSCFMLSLILSFQTTNLLAKDVTLQNLQGDPILFSSLKGKWVFINYWAKWCHNCLDEIPELNRFYRMNKEKNMALFAVNYDGLSQDEQHQLIKELHVTYPSLSVDPAQKLHLGDIQALPVTFVFNPSGKLHDILYGGQTFATLNSYLKSQQTSG